MVVPGVICLVRAPPGEIASSFSRNSQSVLARIHSILHDPQLSLRTIQSLTQWRRIVASVEITRHHYRNLLHLDSVREPRDTSNFDWVLPYPKLCPFAGPP
jgi:hypothetical protein